MSIPTPVFVSGGSGYIGVRLVQRLRAQAAPVRAIVRSQPAQRRLEALGVDQVQLGSPEFFAPMRQAIHGAAAAVHLVGTQREVRGSTFEHANRLAGEMFARVAKEVGVEKAVLVTCTGLPGISLRIRSQRAAEAALRATGVPYTILRLAPVYGPESRLTAWLETLARGEAGPVPRAGSACWRPLSVEDAVDAILAVLEPRVAHDEVVEVGGGEALTLRQMAALFSAAGTAPREATRVRGFRRQDGDDPLAPIPPVELGLDIDPGPEGAATLGLSPSSIRQFAAALLAPVRPVE